MDLLLLPRRADLTLARFATGHRIKKDGQRPRESDPICCSGGVQSSFHLAKNRPSAAAPPLKAAIISRLPSKNGNHLLSRGIAEKPGPTTDRDPLVRPALLLFKNTTQRNVQTEEGE
jgi:hypothetical protein